MKDGLNVICFVPSTGITIGGSLVITGLSTMMGLAVFCSMSPLGLMLGTKVGSGVAGTSWIWTTGAFVVLMAIVGTTFSVVGLNVVGVNFDIRAVVVVGFSVVVLETACVVVSFVEVIRVFDDSLSVVLGCSVTASFVLSDLTSVTDFDVVGLADSVVFDVSVVVTAESFVVVFIVVAASGGVVLASVFAFSFSSPGELVVLAICDFVVFLASTM